jgi:hypothetical protein
VGFFRLLRQRRQTVANPSGLVVAPNAILDPDRVEVLPGTPDLFTTATLATRYDPDDADTSSQKMFLLILGHGSHAAVAPGTAVGPKDSAEAAFVALVACTLAPDLAKVVLAWPSLSPEMRRILLALCEHLDTREREEAAP